MNDWPARIDPKEAAIGWPTPTAHRLDGVVRAIRMLRTAPEPDPGDRVVRLSAQMIGLRFTARGAGRRAALVAASPRPRAASCRVHGVQHRTLAAVGHQRVVCGRGAKSYAKMMNRLGGP